MTMRNRAAQAEKFAEAVEGGCADSRSELVNVYNLVGTAFAPEAAPVDRILGRAGERTMLEAALAGRARPRRFVWRFAAIAGIVMALTAVLFFAKPAPPSAKTIIAKVMAAIEQPNMITYYKITTKMRTPFGTRRYVEEHWIDYKNEMEKSVSKSEGGNDEFLTLVKDGRSINIEKVGDRIDVSEGRALKPFSDWLKDSVKSFRADIKSGRAKLVGEEVIGGVATYKIRIQDEPQDAGRVDKRKLVMAWTINIRKDNFLPVRGVSERLLIGPDGETAVDGAEASDYSAVKLIDPATLGRDFFSLDIPKGASYQYAYGFKMAEAKEFKEFDLYYLGDSFAGLDAPGFFQYHKEVNQPYSIEGLPESYVNFDYTDFDEDGDDSILIMIRPKFDLRVLIDASYKGGRQTPLEINGNEAVLVEKDWGRIVTRVILMQVGRSTIHIVAKEKETLIKAAESLKKIN